MKSQYRLAIALLAASAMSYGAHPKIARDLEQVDPQSTVDVIVQYRQIPGEAQHQRIRAMGGRHKMTLDSVKGGVHSVRAGTLAEIAADPDVVYISPDRAINASSFEYAPPAVNADLAWAAGADSSKVGVAVIDSGINSAHPDLLNGPVWQIGVSSRVLYEQSFVAGDTSADDAFGHGTHVAGLIAGNGASSTGPWYSSTIRGMERKVSATAIATRSM